MENHLINNKNNSDHEEIKDNGTSAVRFVGGGHTNPGMHDSNDSNGETAARPTKIQAAPGAGGSGVGVAGGSGVVAGGKHQPKTNAPLRNTVCLAGNPCNPPSASKPKLVGGANSEATVHMNRLLSHQMSREVASSEESSPEKALTLMAVHEIEERESETAAQYRYFDFNFHAVKKSVSSGLLDVALLMANTSQLKHVYLAGRENNAFFDVVVTILALSIILQLFIGVAIIFLNRININEADDEGHRQAEILNNVVVVCIFFLTALNIFATSLGLQDDYGGGGGGGTAGGNHHYPPETTTTTTTHHHLEWLPKME